MTAEGGRRPAPRAFAPLDQQYAAVRQQYESLNLREWLAALPRHRPADVPLLISTRIRLVVPQPLGEAVVYDLAQRALLRAVERWERGEPFTPDSLRDL